MKANAPECLQVSCVQMHWAKPLEFNLERTLHYIGADAREGSRVVVFPEANLTSYYFPYVVLLSRETVAAALERTRQAAAENKIWVIAGTLHPQGPPNSRTAVALLFDVRPQAS